MNEKLPDVYSSYNNRAKVYDNLSEINEIDLGLEIIHRNNFKLKVLTAKNVDVKVDKKR